MELSLFLDQAPKERICHILLGNGCHLWYTSEEDIFQVVECSMVNAIESIKHSGSDEIVVRYEIHKDLQPQTRDRLHKSYGKKIRKLAKDSRYEASQLNTSPSCGDHDSFIVRLHRSKH